MATQSIHLHFYKEFITDLLFTTGKPTPDIGYSVTQQNSDKQFILQSLRNTTENIGMEQEGVMRRASTRLKSDRSLVLEAIKNDKLGVENVLQYVSERLQDDEEVVLKAITVDDVEKLCLLFGKYQVPEENHLWKFIL